MAPNPPPVVNPLAALWPARTWNPGELVTAGMMNSIRDELNELHTTPGVPDSPALTGVPTAPTAAVGTNTTQIATTAFVQASHTEAEYLLTDGATVTAT